jgi:hypothetical protein
LGEYKKTLKAKAAKDLAEARPAKPGKTAKAARTGPAARACQAAKAAQAARAELAGRDTPSPVAFEVYYRHRTFHDVKLVKLFPYDRRSPWEHFTVARPFASEKEKHGFVALMCAMDIMNSADPRVYYINLFDSAFDPIRARTVISDYMDTCTRDSRTQLMVTSSNALLLDRKLFRQDELWIAEPGDYGNTRLLSLGEYKKTLKAKAVWQNFKTSRIGGIYTPLLMAALEAGGNGAKAQSPPAGAQPPART